MTDLHSLDERIRALKELGANQFDPVRFCFIESLHRRAKSARAVVAGILELKVQQALINYQDRLSQAQEDAEPLVTKMKALFPESSDQIQNTFDCYDYVGLVNLLEVLEQKHNKLSFSDLSDQLLHNGDNSNDSASLSFGELLQQQERALFNPTDDPRLVNHPVKRELKSIRRFRETQEALNMDKLVRQSIKEGPENPGPINPHMLAIRALSNMQNLSPQYLKYFISYIDTVFWLESTSDESISLAKAAQK